MSAGENFTPLGNSQLRERLRQAGLEAAGQRRNVTVLFADLSGYTALSHELGDEEIYHLLQQFLQQLSEDVYRYEGIVDKFTGDGLMALFGAPIAYENNAERAMRAALDMQVGIAQLRHHLDAAFGMELKMRIGLHAGSVIIGGVGTNTLMDFTAIGDTVNLASRLENAAEPGTILASETVYRQTRMLFDFAELQSLELKGYDQPVAGYRVLGVRRDPGQVRGIEGLSAPMIGRDLEMDRLQEAFASLVEDNNGQVVLVTGEAGIGKTRLTREIKTYARQKYPNQLALIEGQSLTYRKSMSYWLFQDALRNHLGISPEENETDIRRTLRSHVHALLGAHASEVLPFLEYLLALEPSDGEAAERIRYLEAGQLRRQIFLSVRDWLLSVAVRQPVCLILDDLHWADDASLELVRFLLDIIRQAPVMLYCISRSFQAGLLESIQDRAHAQLADRLVEITVRSLQPTQSDTLLHQLLTSADLPESFREQVIQRAAGVPFYLEEILRMLIENRVLERDGERWRLVNPEATPMIGVPETLEGLILARFDRLTRQERRILQVASIIGRNFALLVLKTVIDEHGGVEQLPPVLDTLVEREFLAVSHDRLGEYQFRHVLTSDAIYKTLLRRDRELLHGQVAQAIETCYADRLESQVELLADHYMKSQLQTQALHYLLLAGRKAARDFANEQARQHYEMALSLLPHIPYQPLQLLQIQMGLGDVLALVGEYQAARTHYRSGLEAVLVQQPGEFVEERSDLQRKTGLTFERQGDFDKALMFFNLAELLLEESPRPLPVLQARILEDMGWIYFRRSHTDLAEDYLGRALALVQDTTQYDVIASIYNRLGGVAYQKRDLAQAARYTRQSLEMREAIGDIQGAARSYNNLGLLAYEMGNWQEALENYKKNLELQTRIGDMDVLAISYVNIGNLQVDLGDFEEAHANIHRSLQAAEQTGALFHTAFARLTFGRLAIWQSRFREALTQLSESLQIFKEIGAQEHLINVYLLLGEANLGLGDAESAERWAGRTIDLIARLGSQSLGQSDQHGQAIRLQGKVALARRQWDTAEKHFKACLDIFTLDESLVEQARTKVEMGRLALLQNEKSRAAALAGEAVQVFLRLGARYDASVAGNLLADSRR